MGHIRSPQDSGSMSASGPRTCKKEVVHLMHRAVVAGQHIWKAGLAFVDNMLDQRLHTS